MGGIFVGSCMYIWDIIYRKISIVVIEGTANKASSGGIVGVGAGGMISISWVSDVMFSKRLGSYELVVIPSSGAGNVTTPG